MSTSPPPQNVRRCAWVSDDPLYRAYHDTEWGVPERDSRALWESLMLEGFQAGLSWITVLRRREGFRRAFAGFDPAVVARFDEADVERLMADAGIIRNRAKILATMGNARLVEAMAPGELDALMWSFAPSPRPTGERPVRFADVPATTAASDALSQALKKRGFRFVGSTTMYALMQSAGMVDDHLVGCHRAA